jgi:hypothetical protein
MVERRENKVGNAHSFGNVGDILALGIFNIGFYSLPVVCDQEDSVRTLEGCGQGVDRVQISLRCRPQLVFFIF